MYFILKETAQRILVLESSQANYWQLGDEGGCCASDMTKLIKDALRYKGLCALLRQEIGEGCQYCQN